MLIKLAIADNEFAIKKNKPIPALSKFSLNKKNKKALTIRFATKVITYNFRCTRNPPFQNYGRPYNTE